MRGRVDRWLLLIVAAFALRAILALVLALTQLTPHNGWYWANDDQVQYYGIAHALINGDIAEAYTFMGYGVLLAPFVLGTEFVLQAVPPVAIVQFLLAIPAAVLLYRAGIRLADRRAAAVGTALWLTTPLWLSTIWFPSYSEPFAMSTTWLGMQVSVDYASALLAIGVLYVAAGAQGDASARRGAVVGLLAGTAFLAKPSNLVIVGSAFVALMVWRRWHSAIAMGAVSGVVFSAQLVFNWRLNGNPATFSYSDAWPFGDTKSLASITYVPRSIGKLFLLNYTGPLLCLAAAAALVVTWRRFPAMRWLAVAQVVGFLLFFSPLYYSISEFMLRFLTPALPALCLAAGCALVGRSRLQAPVAIRRPGWVATLACGGAAVGAAALAVLVAVAPLRPILPVVPSLAADAVASGGRVTVSWHAPAAPASLAYEVSRSREAGPSGDDAKIWRGLATTIDDRPGPGTWFYRVYLTPTSTPRAGRRAFRWGPRRRYGSAWSGSPAGAPPAVEDRGATCRGGMGESLPQPLPDSLFVRERSPRDDGSHTPPVDLRQDERRGQRAGLKPQIGRVDEGSRHGSAGENGADRKIADDEIVRLRDTPQHRRRGEFALRLRLAGDRDWRHCCAYPAATTAASTTTATVRCRGDARAASAPNEIAAASASGTGSATRWL